MFHGTVCTAARAGQTVTAYWAVWTVLIRHMIHWESSRNNQQHRGEVRRGGCMNPGLVPLLHARCTVEGHDADRDVCSSLHASRIFELNSAKEDFSSCKLGLLLGLLAVIKAQTPCLQIRVLDLSSLNPTSNMHLSPGQLAQITTALPEKGLFEP